MQAIKAKISGLSARPRPKPRLKRSLRRSMQKARLDVAHKVRLAKEAEASMDLHVAKDDRKAQRELAKHTGEPIRAPNKAPPTPDMIAALGAAVIRVLSAMIPTSVRTIRHLTNGYKKN